LNRIEKIMIIALIIVSVLMLYNLSLAHLLIYNQYMLFEGWIHYIFYVLAIFVPMYIFLQWLFKKKRLYLYLTGLTSLPIVVFGIWFIYMIKALGEALSQF